MGHAVSVEATALALNHSRATGSAKLVLLGIANHDGDGGAWPSVATLARYAAVDVRSVQRALGKLEALGEIRIRRNAGGTHLTPDHMRPNLYLFTLRCPIDCDGTKQHRVGKQLPTFDPLTPASPPGASVTPPPGTSVTRTTPETPRARERATGGSTRVCASSPSGQHQWEPSGWCLYGDAHQPEQVDA